jgi:hypothetical protein
MTPLQIVAILFALFSLGRLVVQFKHGFNHRELFLWTVVWGGLLVVSFVPNVLRIISDWSGVQQPLDFMIYVSIVALFYLVFRLYLKINEVEEEITKVVRELAKK